MNLLFLGATQTVTGSKFLVEHGNTRLLVDCGLFQGYKWLRQRNWQPPAFDIHGLDGILLTHAHLDHSGYIPRLYQLGYRGPVFCHPATVDLCSILLPDAGHIQEEDARFYARHRLGKHAHPEPLYDGETAERSLELFQPIAFGESVRIGEITARLQSAGHILGAGSGILEAGGKRVGFSGDVGRPDDVLMYPPDPLPALDLLLLESTYGDRRHPDLDIQEELNRVVNEVVGRGGVLVIPSFAVGRAQTLQHMLVRAMEAGDIPRLPIFLDSPMAIDASHIYNRYPELHRLTKAECRRMSEGVTYTREIEESKALDNIQYPHIIIAGSGMASGGRVLHHLKRLLPNHRTTVLFAGYQAGGTRGARLMAGSSTVKIHGEYIPCRAQVEMLEGLSAHADYRDLGRWLHSSQLQPGTAIQLVHGEPDAADCLRLYLQDHTRFEVEVAQYRQILRL
ncbi:MULTISPECIES: MBL fold metallo-hydrolase RNA specificity domain-containing protein [Microbulbifer]|uniref:MBL fold metallo-hydrolase RNA specificity domain-containing protein n=1 Tax=Microbulbifer TaxID=48073 RepID=UPI001E3A0D1C|nr:MULTISPECIES: MBL fold metallo-hydrolase [Microbulbifer]UHQ56203.1 MBL fold metallo-hydrolase [Microbulbifer sp. YPW16]